MGLELLKSVKLLSSPETKLQRQKLENREEEEMSVCGFLLICRQKKQRIALLFVQAI